MTRQERDYCSACGRVLRVRADGMIRAHLAEDGSPFCEGSGRPPPVMFVADFGSAGHVSLEFRGVDYFELGQDDRRYVAGLLDRFNWQRVCHEWQPS